jgi:hypothetical protein
MPASTWARCESARPESARRGSFAADVSVSKKKKPAPVPRSRAFSWVTARWSPGGGSPSFRVVARCFESCGPFAASPSRPSWCRSWCRSETKDGRWRPLRQLRPMLGTCAPAGAVHSAMRRSSFGWSCQRGGSLDGLISESRSRNLYHGTCGATATHCSIAEPPGRGAAFFPSPSTRGGHARKFRASAKESCSGAGKRLRLRTFADGLVTRSALGRNGKPAKFPRKEAWVVTRWASADRGKKGVCEGRDASPAAVFRLDCHREGW